MYIFTKLLQGCIHIDSNLLAIVGWYNFLFNLTTFISSHFLWSINHYVNEGVLLLLTSPLIIVCGNSAYVCVLGDPFERAGEVRVPLYLIPCKFMPSYPVIHFPMQILLAEGFKWVRDRRSCKSCTGAVRQRISPPVDGKGSHWCQNKNYLRTLMLIAFIAESYS